MSIPFGQKTHAGGFSAEPDVSGRVYSVRIVTFVGGAKIAFNQPDNALPILSSCSYPFPASGWERIYLSGTVTIEYSLDPNILLEAPSTNLDANGNNQVTATGPDADAVVATGKPLLVAGKSAADGKVRTLQTDANGIPLMQGTAAENNAVVGNPVLIACRRDQNGNVGIPHIAFDGDDMTITTPGGLVMMGRSPSTSVTIGMAHVVPVALDGDAGGVVASTFIPGGGYDSTGAARRTKLDTSGRALAGGETKDFSGTSPAAAGTTLGATYAPVGSYKRAHFLFRVQGATGGTLDVYVQTSHDGGTTWVDVIHLTQLAAAAALAAYTVVLEQSTANISACNTLDGTPILTANNALSRVGNAWRVVYVSGAGTSAGAAQVIKAQFS